MTHASRYLVITPLPGTWPRRLPFPSYHPSHHRVISLHQVRDLVRAHFGPDRFQYVYHIDQV